MAGVWMTEGRPKRRGCGCCTAATASGLPNGPVWRRGPEGPWTCRWPARMVVVEGSIRVSSVNQKKVK